MIRPWSNVEGHSSQPCMSAFRALMYLMWGPPPNGGLLACHVACDHHRCMNPTHGRWGTHADNYWEWRLLENYYQALAEASTWQADSYKVIRHPCKGLLASQGFACYR